MTYAGTVFNHYWLAFGLMYARQILHIHLVSHYNGVYIGTYYRTKPHRTIVAHGYITCQRSVFCEVATLSPLWTFASC